MQTLDMAKGAFRYEYGYPGKHGFGPVIHRDGADVIERIRTGTVKVVVDL
jgi:hypothetical protein